MRRAPRRAKAGHASIAVDLRRLARSRAGDAADRAADAELLRGLPSAKTRSPGCRGRTQRLTTAAATAPASPRRLVRATCGARRTRPSDAGWSGPPGCCARPTCPPRPPRARGGQAGRGDWPRSAAGPCRADRAHRRDPSVLCHGDEVAVAAHHRHLVVGEELGAVPRTPVVPLRPTSRRRAGGSASSAAGWKDVELDLRGDTDRARSVLLHRLPCSASAGGRSPRRGQGRPGRSTRRGRCGGVRSWPWPSSTRPAGARPWPAPRAAKITAAAASASNWARSPRPVEQVLLADLPDALGPVLRALDRRAAADSDVAHLMAAIPPLVRAVRYGERARHATPSRCRP